MTGSTTTIEPRTAVKGEAGASLWRDAWHRLKKNVFAVAGGCLVLTLTLACLIVPAVFDLSYEAQGLDIGAVPPLFPIVRIYRNGSLSEVSDVARLLESGKLGTGGPAEAARTALATGNSITIDQTTYRPGHYWLGSDVLGRDLLARILYGGRISLKVASYATLVSLGIGVTYGAFAGFLGGKTDSAMMRLVDILYALPFTIFVILLMTFFGRNESLLFIAIGAVEWLTMARIVRGQVLTIKRMEYIEAARTLGFSRKRIIFRHIIPNIIGPVIVYTTLTIPAVMLLESFLSFLGLGIQPPKSSWGTLIKDGAEKMEEYWWLLVFPGSIFSLTLFSLNFLGDGLRDALDVRAAKD